MGYFPMCVDLSGRTVLLVGSGPRIADKRRKLEPFGAKLLRTDRLAAENLTEDVAFVVVGDTDPAEAARISGLCRGRGIPVNVVDQPDLCSFFFPALITRGPLTVSVSTGGQAPGAAGHLARRIDAQLPDRTEEILDWLHVLRAALYEQLPAENARRALYAITREAFDRGQPLTDDEVQLCVIVSSGQATGKL